MSTTTRRTSARPLILVTILAGLANPAHAAVIDWNGATSGLFDDPTAWIGGNVPGANDVASFPNAGTYTVTFSSNVTNDQFNVPQGTVTFALSGLQWVLDLASCTVGNVAGQTARATFSHGEVNLTAGNLVIGSTSDDTGFVTVTTDARVTSTSQILVGSGGTGTLTIQNGGDVVSTLNSTIGSTSLSLGTATISGAGSTWTAASFSIGNSGIGSLTISGGGAASATSGGSFTTIGGQVGAEGTLSVSGAGSTFSAVHELRVGGTGVGTLTISSGGAVSSTTGLVGQNAGGVGTVTVTGPSSTWSMSTALNVGFGGTGALNVTAGGAVVNVAGTIGANAGSQGTVLVDGSGSTWTSQSQINVGSLGSGTLTVSNGGQCLQSAASLLLIGASAGSSGALTITDPGSAVSSLGTMVVGSGGSGTLQVLNGGSLTTASGKVAGSAGGVGTATVAGPLSVWNSGDLTIGFATGGNGSLTLGAGGTINAGAVTLVDPAGAPTATLTLNTGGVLNVSGGLGRAAGTTLAFNGGLLNVTGGTFSNGVALTNLTIEGLAVTDLPTLRLSGAAKTSNIAGLIAGNLRGGAVEVLAGADLTTTGATLGVFNGSTGTVTVDGVGSTWSYGSSLTVGRDGTGLLNVTGGGAVTGTDVIVTFQAGTGTANVLGAGSQLVAAGQLIVGQDLPGTLNITGGGRAFGTTTLLGNSITGVGTVNVDGAASKLVAPTLDVGHNGTGSIAVTGGGAVEVAGTATVAINTPTSSGAITLSGAGSSMTANTLNIGSANSAQATVLAGAGTVLSVTNGLNLNDPAGAFNGVLSIDGGSVTVSGTLLRRGVLLFNDGTLTLDGGNLDNGAAATPLVVNGTTDAAHPTLRLVRASFLTNVSDLSIGGNRVGSLYVDSGSSADAANVSIAANAGGVGEVVIEGGLSASGTLTVGGNGIFNGGKGTLSILPGGVVQTTNLRLAPQGVVHLTGGLVDLEAIFSVPGATFDFQSGTVQFVPNTNLTSGSLGLLLGPAHRLVGGQTLNCLNSFTLQSDLTVSGGLLSAFNLTIDDVLTLESGQVSLFGGATINAGRTLALAGGRFHSDLPITNNGQIVLSNPLARLTGAASLVNSGLVSGSGQIDRPLINNAAGQVRVGAGQRLWFAGAGAHSNSGLVDVTGGTVEFSAPLTNAAATGLIAARDGILRFGGGLSNAGSLTVTTGISDVYGDVTNVVGGRIVVSGGGFATFYDDVTNAGQIQVSKAGTLTSTAVFFGTLAGNGVAGAGNVFAEGDVRPGFSPGTMAFGGDLALGPFSRLSIEIGGLIPGTQFDRLTVASGLTLDGTLAVSLINGFVPAVGNSFDILDWNALSGTFSQTVLPALAPGLSWDASNLYTTGVLSIVPLEFQWAVDAGGLWSVGTNWTTGVEPNGAGVPVRFGSVITAPRVVTLDAPRTAGVITFDNAHAYTIAGPNQLTLDGPAPAINVVQGSHTIAAPLAIAAGRTLVVQGPGTLTLSGVQHHGAGATLSLVSGTLNLNADGGANLTIANQSALNLGATQHLAGLSVGPAATATLTAGGSKVLVTRDLSLAAGAALDLANNDAVVQANAITRAAVLASVTAHVASGFNAFAWNGTGIRSSAAAGDATLLTALGVMLNDDGLGGAYHATFSGEAVDANSILVKYTYYGDADLSGVVDGTDYALTDNGFNAGLVGWFNGDFDYSGTIDGTDYALIDNAFNSQTGPLGAAAVPEPATALLLASAGLLMPLARRRRA